MSIRGKKMIWNLYSTNVYAIKWSSDLCGPSFHTYIGFWVIENTVLRGIGTLCMYIVKLLARPLDNPAQRHTQILMRYNEWFSNSISVDEQMGLNLSGSLVPVTTNTARIFFFFRNITDRFLVAHQDHPTCFHVSKKIIYQEWHVYTTRYY